MAETSLQNALLQIAKDQNFTAPKIAIDESPNHGYIANVNRITLKDSETDATLHLFAKSKPKEIKGEWEFFYKNEAEFYNKVVAAFKEILQNHGNKLTLPLMPKCYFANDEIVILEDLLETGYKIWSPLNEPLDKNHVKAVLSAYGKFHAFSFAFKHKYPEKFASIGYKFEWFQTNYERLINNGFYKGLTEKLADCFDQETEFEYIEAIANFLSHGQVAYLEKLALLSESDVFVHGDSWTHNYMFRYDVDEPKPKDVCILDFQIFRKTSPVIDLSYFISTCACTPEFFNDIDVYLKVYHESLQTHLSQLNCPDVYTWDTLQYEWRNYSLKGLIMAGIILKMMTADKDELEARKHIEMPMQFDFISRNEALYQQRMRIVIKYFYDAGILQS